MSRSHSTARGSFGGEKPRTIEDIARSQGIQGPQDLNKMIGAGADLWGSDAEFDEFVKGIYRRRSEGLSADGRQPLDEGLGK